MSEKKLRVISSKIKPKFNDLEGSEGREGAAGGGPLVRNYCNSLDMEFIAYHARERKDQETGMASARIPVGVLEDMSIIVESGKLPFRDKSQFIRSACIVLLNYYGEKYPEFGQRSRVGLMLDSLEWQIYQKKLIKKYVEKFEHVLSEIIDEYSDDGLDKILREQVRVVNTIKDKKIKDGVVKKFTDVMMSHHIDPIPYFGEESEEATWSPSDDFSDTPSER